MNILMMPLERNIPDPQHDDWKLTMCPKCGAKCWESDLARSIKKLFPKTVAYCTICALTADVRNGEF